MTASEHVPIYLNPQRFWAATRHRKPEQAQSLLEKVSELAERRETEALQEYDFIIVGSLRNYKSSAA
jgi:hypothetical protein